MSTALIVLLVVAVICVAVLALAAVRRNREKQVGRVQTRAMQDDAAHHRDQAREARSEVDTMQERARRVAAEAGLEERKAAERERELKERE